MDEPCRIDPVAVKIPAKLDFPPELEKNKQLRVEPVLFQRLVQYIPREKISELIGPSRNMQKLASPVIAKEMLRRQRRRNVIQHLCQVRNRYSIALPCQRYADRS